VKGPLRVVTGMHVVPPGLKKLPGSVARDMTGPLSSFPLPIQHTRSEM
jgi:hypothetical protein